MSLRERVLQTFAADGPLAQAFEGFSARQGQVDMALAVADAIQKRSVVLAEAGTGTGKTFAYLVPALLSGQRVVVSTATKNLQDQIALRDLPRLLEALQIEARVQVLKGRHNYLCQYRLERANRQPSLHFAGQHKVLQQITEWARETETGDRAELTTMSEDFAAWRDVDGRGDICLGGRCPNHSTCFVVKARQAAHACEVVVVNHHLLCADLALRMRNDRADTSLVPRADVMIFDEAHTLAQVATEHFGATFSEARVGDLCREGLGLLGLDPASGFVREALIQAQTLSTQLFNMIGQQRALDHLEPAVEEATQQLGKHLLAAAESFEAIPSPESEALADRARRLARELDFVLPPGGGLPPDFVRLVEERSRTRAVRALPLSVATPLQSTLFIDPAAVILTSATLSVADDFSTVRDRLGLSAASEIIVESPFDFGKQSLVYVPTKFPEPAHPTYPDALAETLEKLCAASQGGAFFLFTSLRMMRLQATMLRGRLSNQVLVQGDAPKAALLDRFVRDGSAVLFASQSFWEGVDVPGHALRLVAIDKLPFGSPDDPVLKARIAKAESEGENAFKKYQLPDAILSLRQGFGRLIRRVDDRGVVALLDIRLRTRAYGERFLSALPPSPVTNSLDDVAQFFGSGQQAGAIQSTECN